MTILGVSPYTMYAADKSATAVTPPTKPVPVSGNVRISGTPNANVPNSKEPSRLLRNLLSIFIRQWFVSLPTQEMKAGFDDLQRFGIAYKAKRIGEYRNQIVIFLELLETVTR